MAGNMEEMPIKILENSLGKVVLVKLKGGRSIRGKLEGYDQHMNLVLGGAEEVSDPSNVQGLGSIIVRGDNVIIISPPT